MNSKQRTFFAQQLLLNAIDIIEIYVDDEDTWTEEVIALLARALEVAGVKKEPK
jgi:hypothetical protein